MIKALTKPGTRIVVLPSGAFGFAALWACFHYGVHPTLLALWWGFCSAVIGVAMINVVAVDDTPLSWYFKWAFAWQERGGWRSWIASPLGGCVLCTSGQIGLWTSLIPFPWWGWTPSLFFNVLSGCAAVLWAFTINKAYKWLDRKQ